MMENITQKLDELKSVYQENENTIIGLYRNLETSQKQVEDYKMEILRANEHQAGLRREIEDFEKIIQASEAETVSA